MNGLTPSVTVTVWVKVAFSVTMKLNASPVKNPKAPPNLAATWSDPNPTICSSTWSAAEASIRTASSASVAIFATSVVCICTLQRTYVKQTTNMYFVNSRMNEILYLVTVDGLKRIAPSSSSSSDKISGRWSTPRLLRQTDVALTRWAHGCRTVNVAVAVTTFTWVREPMEPKRRAVTGFWALPVNSCSPGRYCDWMDAMHEMNATNTVVKYLFMLEKWTDGDKCRENRSSHTYLYRHGRLGGWLITNGKDARIPVQWFFQLNRPSKR